MISIPTRRCTACVLVLKRCTVQRNISLFVVAYWWLMQDINNNCTMAILIRVLFKVLTLSVQNINCLKRYMVVNSSKWLSTDSVGKFPKSNHDGDVVYAEIKFEVTKMGFPCDGRLVNVFLCRKSSKKAVW